MHFNHDLYDDMLDVYYRHSCVGKSYAPYAEPPDIIGMPNKSYDWWQETNAFDYHAQHHGSLLVVVAADSSSRNPIVH
jgi:hypothetical protein